MVHKYAYAQEKVKAIKSAVYVYSEFCALN